MSRPSTSAQPLSASSASASSHTRILSLLGSTLVALSAGSNYAFSSFAPQLQDIAHLTSTQINVVGLAGNAGVYLSGPLWGRWVDRRGPKSALISGAVMVLVGYWGLSLSYQLPQAMEGEEPADTKLAPPSTQHPFSFPAIVFLNLLTGLGNSGAFTAAMNAQAKSWGGNRRGSATALVLSGFGLSAFVYSSLSHTLFPGNMQDYLLLLAIGSVVSFLIGLAVIRILPPAAEGSALADANGEQEADGPYHRTSLARSPSSTVSYSRRRTSSDLSAIAFARAETMLEQGDADEDSANHFATQRNADVCRGHITRTTPAYGNREDVEPASPSAGLLFEPESSRRRQPGAKRNPQPGVALDVTGLELLKCIDFILLFLIMAFISGAGLLLINNVGTITRTLWRYNHNRGTGNKGAGWPLSRYEAIGSDQLGALAKDDAAVVQQYQAHQVSAISIGNALGRIFIGLMADLTVNLSGNTRLRVWMLLFPCGLAILSQSLAAAPNTVTSIKMLLVVSGSTGLMYGTLFGICPSLNLEFFGLKNFSQNWGYVSLSPVVAGNVFNLLFGRIYDSHVPKKSATHECVDGEECYRAVFVITTWCAVAATVLSLVLIYRRAGNPNQVRRYAQR
ncbi:MFS general substrate transporter [Tilletiaria anomala UBC 951]|uniref:MFS general substrate transporter n=1 Tax=Tilletiaria anomala (strain ATCC 24038 / CBS 436.72 / UBC 951) TaxID=1037660 RepID=A0A066VFV5_TILAU|nr:MFS general substrate transporter [Tilletiaria anomala UBC 951]KDN37450.1 MFS general substrate transporter [Tilletiaria anomala UBC 951]